MGIILSLTTCDVSFLFPLCVQYIQYPCKILSHFNQKALHFFHIAKSVLLNQRRWERREHGVFLYLHNSIHIPTCFSSTHIKHKIIVFFTFWKPELFVCVRKCYFLRKAFITLFLWLPWTHAIWISWLLISIDSKTHTVQLPPHTWDWNYD